MLLVSVFQLEACYCKEAKCDGWSKNELTSCGHHRESPRDSPGYFKTFHIFLKFHSIIAASPTTKWRFVLVRNRLLQMTRTRTAGVMSSCFLWEIWLLTIHASQVLCRPKHFCSYSCMDKKMKWMQGFIMPKHLVRTKQSSWQGCHYARKWSKQRMQKCAPIY